MGNGKRDKRIGIPSPIHHDKNLCEDCSIVDRCVVHKLMGQQALNRMGFITSKAYPPGKKIYAEGEPLGSLHLLCSGLVFGSLFNRNPNESLIYLARSGSFLDLLDQAEGQNQIHTCSAETLTPSVVAFFNYRRLRDVTMEDASFAWDMFDMAIKRLRQLTDWHVSLAFGDAKSKVVFFLLELAEAAGKWDHPHVSIPLKLRRQVWAQAAGISVETVSRVMRELNQTGYIEETPVSLEIRDVRPLQKIAGEHDAA